VEAGPRAMIRHPSVDNGRMAGALGWLLEEVLKGRWCSTHPSVLPLGRGGNLYARLGRWARAALFLLAATIPMVVPGQGEAGNDRFPCRPEVGGTACFNGRGRRRT